MMDKSKLMQERVVYQSKTSNMPLLYQILGITGRAIWPVIFYIAIYFIWTRIFNIRYMHPDDVKAVKVVAIVLLVGVIYLVIKQIIVALDTVSSYQRFDFTITTSRIIFFDIDRMQEQNLDTKIATQAHSFRCGLVAQQYKLFNKLNYIFNFTMEIFTYAI